MCLEIIIWQDFFHFVTPRYPLLAVSCVRFALAVLCWLTGLSVSWSVNHKMLMFPTVPEEFMYNPVSRSYGEPHKRPEVQNATIEFIAPSEYMVITERIDLVILHE